MKRLKPRHSQTLLYILLLVAAIISMSWLKGCNYASKLPLMTDGHSKGDTIDVALVYGPMSYYLYEDTLGGFNYDMMHKMSHDLGIPVRLWPIVSLEEAMKKLENNSYDILASTPLDNNIKNRFLTTKSVFLDKLVLIQNSESNGDVRIKSALDLGEDTIYLQKGSSAVSRILNLSNETGVSIPFKEVEDLSEEYLCIKVANGDIKLAVVNELTAKTLAVRYPSLSYENPISFTQFQVWLLSRSNHDLLSRVNLWIDSISDTPSYHTHLDRYQHTRVRPDVNH